MLRKALQAGQTLHQATPARLRWVFAPAVVTLQLARTLSAHQWVLVGDEVRSRQRLAIFYTGGERNKNYLVKIAYDGACTETYIGKSWLWKARRAAEECGCGLMVSEVPLFFSRLDMCRARIYVPCWILTEIDLSRDTSLLTANSSVRSDLRRVRKNRLGFEVTRDLGRFDDFYYNMHLPYITRMHGNRAFIKAHSAMRSEMRGRELLLIEKGGDHIAGMVLAHMGNAARLGSAGVRDANESYIRDGAMGALYYFSIIYLKERGYRRADFALSRAFLKDGGLQYKRKWTPKLVHDSPSVFQLRVLAGDAGVEGFFLNNPFIRIDRSGLGGAVFVGREQPVTVEYLTQVYRDYYLRGMGRLVVYRLGAHHPALQDCVPPGLSTTMGVESAQGLLAPAGMPLD